MSLKDVSADIMEIIGSGLKLLESVHSTFLWTTNRQELIKGYLFMSESPQKQTLSSWYKAKRQLNPHYQEPMK